MFRSLPARVIVTALLFIPTIVASGVYGDDVWPPELVDFVPDHRNPVMLPGPAGSWDTHIRERGWIIKDGDVFKMWYTGYQGGLDTREKKVPRKLGYATSKDGIVWERHPDNPIHDEIWVEDVCVLKHQGTYYMFAELEHGAHWFTSMDGIKWDRKGLLDIRDSEGHRLHDQAGATPHVFVDQDGTWVFYFQNTGGVWGATSDNPARWTLIKDGPVIEPGPDSYDGDKLAADQVLKYNGRWYMYYHGRGKPRDKENPWGTNIAMSEDGITWVKYPKNPLWTGPISAFLVDDGQVKRLYTTQSQVWVFWPRGSEPK